MRQTTDRVADRPDSLSPEAWLRFAGRKVGCAGAAGEFAGGGGGGGGGGVKQLSGSGAQTHSGCQAGSVWPEAAVLRHWELPMLFQQFAHALGALIGRHSL